MTPVISFPIIIYKDNTICVTQIKGGYIKGDKTKHISLKFFAYNLANLFTKSLPTLTFEKLVYDISMRRVNKLQN